MFSCGLRFTGITYFYLRGLCAGLKNKVDSQFVVDMDTADNKDGLVFTGFKKTMLLLNQKTNRWNIVSLDDGSVIIELHALVKYHIYLDSRNIH